MSYLYWLTDGQIARGTVRCQRCERRPVAAACKPVRNAAATAAGQRSTFDEDRGAYRVDSEGLQGDARHHPGPSFRHFWPIMALRSHSARYGGSSRGAGSRAKKDSARDRA